MRPIFTRLSCIALLSASLSACTTQLQVIRQDDRVALPNGAMPYLLPRKAFVISAEYVLKRCERDPNGEPDIDVDVTVKVVGVNDPDPDHRYYIDFPAQRSRYKTSDYKIATYGQQTLKSFNGSIQDEVGATVAAVIATAAKIGGIFLFTDGAKVQELNKVLPEGKPPGGDPCTPDARAALKYLAAFAAKKAKADIDKANKRPFDPIVDPDVAARQQALDTLTYKEVVEWVPDPQYTEVTIDLMDDAIRNWFSTAGQQALVASQRGFIIASSAKRDACERRPSPQPGTLPCAIYLPDVRLVARLDVGGRPVPVPGTVQPEPGKVYNGLVVRHPVLASLRVCRGACPEQLASSGPKGIPANVDNVLHASNEMIPQFASPVLLPLTNEINQDSELVVEMSEDGVLTSIGYVSKSKVADNIKGLGDSADAVKGAVDARKKALADARTAAASATKDANEALAACLKAQAEILEHGGAPIGKCQ